MSVNLSSITLEQLPQLSEKDLRNKIIKPLLREIGFDYVEDWHGPRKFGIDILIETTDFFNRPRYFGISAKKGNLNNKSAFDHRSITTIHNQMRKAFTKEFCSSNGEAVHLHGYYVIASGSFNREAEDEILAERSKYPYVDIIDGQVLFLLIQERHMLQSRYSAWKTSYQSFSDESEVVK